MIYKLKIGKGTLEIQSENAKDIQAGLAEAWGL